MIASPEVIEQLVQERLDYGNNKKIPLKRTVWGKYDNYKEIDDYFNLRKKSQNAAKVTVVRKHKKRKREDGDEKEILAYRTENDRKIEKAKQKKLLERMNRDIDPLDGPTGQKKTYQPTRSDQKLNSVYLQQFIAAWEAGYVKPRIHWDDDTTREYVKFTKRQTNLKQAEKITASNSPVIPESSADDAFQYVANNDIIPNTYLTKYPMGWLEDFIKVFYETRVLKINHRGKIGFQNEWLQIQGSVTGCHNPGGIQTKWAAYRSFCDNLSKKLHAKSSSSAMESGTSHDGCVQHTS